VHRSIRTIPKLPSSCNGIVNGKSFQKLIEFEQDATWFKKNGLLLNSKISSLKFGYFWSWKRKILKKCGGKCHNLKYLLFKRLYLGDISDIEIMRSSWRQNFVFVGQFASTFFPSRTCVAVSKILEVYGGYKIPVLKDKFSDNRFPFEIFAHTEVRPWINSLNKQKTEK
jgi:hypothetical protein